MGPRAIGHATRWSWPQIALALVLLIVSGLMIRTFVAMRQVDPASHARRKCRRSASPSRQALISDPQQAAPRVPEHRRASGAGAGRRRRWACPRRSRWTAKTTAMRSTSRTSPCPRARFGRCGASRASRPDTSRRWATAWWRDAPSRGRTSTSAGPSSSSRRRSRGCIGRSRPGRSANASATAQRCHGGRSSASSATSVTMA